MALTSSLMRFFIRNDWNFCYVRQFSTLNLNVGFAGARHCRSINGLSERLRSISTGFPSSVNVRSNVVSTTSGPVRIRPDFVTRQFSTRFPSSLNSRSNSITPISNAFHRPKFSSRPFSTSNRQRGGGGGSGGNGGNGQNFPILKLGGFLLIAIGVLDLIAEQAVPLDQVISVRKLYHDNGIINIFIGVIFLAFSFLM